MIEIGESNLCFDATSSRSGRIGLSSDGVGRAGRRGGDEERGGRLRERVVRLAEGKKRQA